MFASLLGAWEGIRALTGVGLVSCWRLGGQLVLTKQGLGSG